MWTKECENPLDRCGKKTYKDPMTQPQPDSSPVKPPWYDTAGFRWVMMTGILLLIIGKCVQLLVFKTSGQDFEWHLRLGQTVLDGTPYVMPDGTGIGDHYLPGRVLIDAVLELLGLKGAQALSLGMTLLGLWVIVRLWGEMADGAARVGKGVHLAGVVLGFVLLAPWVVRDFDEAGLQFQLLTMLTLAGWCVYRGKSVAAGVWLALAISFKSTPVLFLPLLLYKRQWAAAGATVVFLIVFNVLVPGIIWGPEKTQHALGKYWERVTALSKNTDPSENGIEPPKHQNQSLPFAITRYLQTYPVGHPLFFHEKFNGDFANQKETAATDPALGRPHWGFVQFLDLDDKTVKRVIRGVLAMIALALAWRMRKRWGSAAETAWEGAAAEQKDEPSGLRKKAGKTSALAPEWAVACAFAALMSPLTWLHHFVLMLPCAYLAVRDLLREPQGRRWRWVAMGVVVVCVWVLQRDPLPKQLAVLSMSYHEDVLACLLLVVLALTVKEGLDAGPEKARLIKS